MYPTNELDPCVFCSGSESDKDLSINYKLVQNETIWFVKCFKCSSSGPEKSSRKEAIEAWNNRDNFRLKRDGMECIRISNNNDPFAIVKDAFIMTGIFAFRAFKSLHDLDLLQPGEIFIQDSYGKSAIFYTLDFYECSCGRKQPKAAENKIGIGEKAAESVGWRKIDGKWKCPFCCNSTDALFNIFKKAEEENQKDPEDPL